MPNRRKFLAGLGSLAAGGAAATGTGALSSAQAQRDVKVNITGDQSSNIRVYTDSDAGEEFVEFEENGEFKLTFDEIDGSGENGGMGFNADSVYYFNDLFEIEHYSTDGALGFYFDRESVPEEITFYNGGDGPVPLDYYSITADSLDEAGGSGGNSILDSQVVETEYGENALLVDVQIDLRNSDRSAGDVIDETDSIVFVAEKP